MNSSALRLAAMLLPLIGLTGAWIATHRLAQQGTEWDVPVAGYDPRDLLRGHYIAYRYDWPGLAADSYAEQLCLIGRAPVIARVREARPDEEGSQACPDFVRDDGARSWSGGNWAGRLYIPQKQGQAMEAKLADPQIEAMVRVRVRPDGHITPLRMTFRSRPPVP